MTPSSINPQRLRESRDGSGAADHDVAFVFGCVPHALAPFPFSTREFARLMVLRSRLQAEDFHDDNHA
jgi:hypothetical protein